MDKEFLPGPISIFDPADPKIDEEKRNKLKSLVWIKGSRLKRYHDDKH